MQFPPPVGAMTAMYTLHSEVALFPVSFGERGLRPASFKIAFPPEFLAQLRLIVDLGLARTDTVKVRAGKGRSAQVVPRETLIALLAERQASTASREPNDCDVLRVVAREHAMAQMSNWSRRWSCGPTRRGASARASLTLASRWPSRVSCWRAADIPPGAHGAEWVFDPHEFLRELARYGMRASETSTRMLS